MKKNVLLYIGILTSCGSSALHTQKNNCSNVELHCEIENQSLKLTFTNHCNGEIRLYPPSFRNCLIFLKNNSVEMQQKIRFKNNIDTMFYELLSNKSKCFYYPCKLSDLFDLSKGMEYDIIVDYYFYQNGKVKNKLTSNSYKFFWK